MSLKSAVKDLLRALDDDSPQRVTDYEGLPQRAFLQCFKDGDMDECRSIITALEEQDSIIENQQVLLRWSDIFLRFSKQLFTQIFARFN